MTISRYIGERFLLETSDGDVWIEIGDVYLHGRPAQQRDMQVRVRIEAPQAVKISREEIVPREAVKGAQP